MSEPENTDQVKTVYVWSPDHYPRHWCPQVIWPVELERIMTSLHREARRTQEALKHYDDGIEEESSDMQIYLEGYRKGIERVVSLIGEASVRKPVTVSENRTR